MSMTLRHPSPVKYNGRTFCSLDSMGASRGFLIHVSSMADAEDIENSVFYDVDDTVISCAMGAHSFQLSS